MKILTDKLNRRFMKDIKMPCSYINKEIFKERLELFEETHKAKTQYKEFIKMIETFENPNNYFEYITNLILKITEYIRGTDNFKKINSFDIVEEQKNINILDIPGKTIYNEKNINKVFISFDLKKANYNIFKKISNESNLLTNSNTYEEFILEFTEFQYIANSKNLRQVIFGQLKQFKRVKFQEKKIINDIANLLINMDVFKKEDIELLLTDELIISGNRLKNEEDFINIINIIEEDLGFACSYEMYELKKFKGLKSFVKKHYFKTNEVKNLSKLMYPAYLKYLKNLAIIDSDLYFIHEDKLAKFLEIPNFEYIE